jgi:hypothetical protein
MRDPSFFYPHSSSVEIEQPLNFHEPFELVSLHPSILLVRRLGFLWFDSRTTRFDTVVHTVLHMEATSMVRVD